MQVCAARRAYVSLFFWGDVLSPAERGAAQSGAERCKSRSENTPVRMWRLRLSLCSAARETQARAHTYRPTGEETAHKRINERRAGMGAVQTRLHNGTKFL